MLVLATSRAAEASTVARKFCTPVSCIHADASSRTCSSHSVSTMHLAGGMSTAAALVAAAPGCDEWSTR